MYNEGGLSEDSTCKDYLCVEREGQRKNLYEQALINIMDKSTDHETNQRLMEAVNLAKTARQKLEQKEAEKLWTEIESPLTLADALSRLIKDDLQQIRSHLDIRRASTLNKQDLIKLLIQQIPEKIESQFYCLDQERYHLICKAVKNGGYTLVSDMEPNQITHFHQRGILFSGTINGKKALVMPQETLLKFNEIEDRIIQPIVRRNTEWIKLIHGLLYYYGTLSTYQLMEMLQTVTHDNVRPLDYIPVLYDAESYYGVIRMDSVGVSNYRVWDAEEVRREHLARPKVNYFPFTKEQLLQAGEKGFVDRNLSYTEFVNFLVKNFACTKQHAEMIVGECVYAIRIGQSIPDIMSYLEHQVEYESMEQLQAFMDKLMPLMNNTRQWFLKGHTPDELFAEERKFLRPLPKNEFVPSNVINIRTGLKVGRNDPCPCGSGKKFKKCCG